MLQEKKTYKTTKNFKHALFAPSSKLGQLPTIIIFQYSDFIIYFKIKS